MFLFPALFFFFPQFYTVPGGDGLLRRGRPIPPEYMIMTPHHLFVGSFQGGGHAETPLRLGCRHAGKQREKAISVLFFRVCIIPRVQGLAQFFSLFAGKTSKLPGGMFPVPWTSPGERRKRDKLNKASNQPPSVAGGGVRTGENDIKITFMKHYIRFTGNG